MNNLPIVAIIGRPNVGKSTLFNRVIGKRKSIVEDIPGITLDRIIEECSWNDKEFLLVDTGGIILSPQNKFEKELTNQVESAIRDADFILFIVDKGITSMDEIIAQKLRASGKKVLLVINKVDNPSLAERDFPEYHSLGLGSPFLISSIHGLGVAELLDKMTDNIPQIEKKADDDDIIKIAVVGRANVGKSSYINKLLGEDRLVVMSSPGTTRDSVDTKFSFDYKGEKRSFILIDTAGLRKTKDSISYYSILRTLSSIKRADTILLMIEALEGISRIDKQLFSTALQEQCGIVVGVNKWDLVKEDKKLTPQVYEKHQKLLFEPLEFVPFVTFSALNGEGLFKPLVSTLRVAEQRKQKVRTSELNELLFKLLRQYSPPNKSGKRVKFFYATQKSSNPPIFILFMKNANLVANSYQKFIINQIRKRFDFSGVPLKLILREKS